MDNNTNVEALLERYFAGQCTPEEAARVKRYISDTGNDEVVDRFMAKKWSEAQLTEKDRSIAVPVKDRYPEIKRKIFPRQPMPALYFRIAATLLVVLLAGGAYVKRMALLDTFFPVKMLSISTRRGEQVELTLPDGTKVWLNTASTLQYPEKFRGDTRNVRLTGEAYFKVKRDTTKPFFVNAGRFYTQVLGTAFNVKAYAEKGEDICVTVTEGQVAVGMENENKAHKEFARLTRNHRATFDRITNVLFRDSVASEEVVAWREGNLSFHNVPLREMTATLERWFGVKITVQNTEAFRCSFSGSYHKGVKLQDILEAMHIMGRIDYELKGNTVKINPRNNCKN